MAKGSLGISKAVQSFFDNYFTMQKLRQEKEERAYQRAYQERQYELQLEKFFNDLYQQKQQEIANQQKQAIDLESKRGEIVNKYIAIPKEAASEYGGAVLQGSVLNQLYQNTLGGKVFNDENLYVPTDIATKNVYEDIGQQIDDAGRVYKIMRNRFTGEQKNILTGGTDLYEEINTPQGVRIRNKLTNQIQFVPKDTESIESQQLKAIAPHLGNIQKMMQYAQTVTDKGNIQFLDEKGKTMEVPLNNWSALMQKEIMEAATKVGISPEQLDEIKSMVESKKEFKLGTQDREGLEQNLRLFFNSYNKVSQKHGKPPLTKPQQEILRQYYLYKNRLYQLMNKQK